MSGFGKAPFDGEEQLSEPFCQRARQAEGGIEKWPEKFSTERGKRLSTLPNNRVTSWLLLQVWTSKSMVITSA
jgi:hypothetical protein